MAATHTLPLASPGMARICLYGDLQRFGRRIDLRVKTGAEAIRALATQLPAFRQKLCDGWYQVRIAGRDVSTSGLTAQLHETLPDGAVIHIVPRRTGHTAPGVSSETERRLVSGTDCRAGCQHVRINGAVT
nr:hypothetical protein [Escherichia coli]